MIQRWKATLFLAVALVSQGNAQQNTAVFRLLAFGDVNLGRTVGKRILRGELDYPFARLKEKMPKADAIFVNLESVVSDQGGETEHPRSNITFCAPPAATVALRVADVTVAATANNHAFDYGPRAVGENIRFLAGQRIAAVGSSEERTANVPPVIVERNGLRVAFLAYTEFMNVRDGWQSYIAEFDSARVRTDVVLARQAADIVVASYHGGAEYRERPSSRARANMRLFIDAGADMVIGHHPHVPQGFEKYRGKWIAYSLGNTVFYQPQRDWTHLGFALDVAWTRSDSVRMTAFNILPLRAGYQPFFTSDPDDVQRLRTRLVSLSNILVEDQPYDSTFSFRLRP